MLTLMRHFVNSNRGLQRKIKKVGKKAQRMYPHVRWSIQMPSPEMLETYGDGFIMSAGRRDLLATYYVLADDPRIENWIHMLAIEVDPQVQEHSFIEFR